MKNIIELYEEEYKKYKDTDSIPVILNISKKQFNYLRYLESYRKNEDFKISIDTIQLDNTHQIKIEEIEEWRNINLII